jgi:prevent-host-death family protein
MATLAKSLPPAPALGKSKSTRILSALPRKTSLSRVAQREPIAAAKAKTHFLQLLDQVEQDRVPITITKRGRVVAQLTPVAVEIGKSSLENMIGRLRGSIKITGDIVSPDHDFWGPDWR